FERIHRTNLIGMGVLPCQFRGSDSVASLKIDGSETFDLLGIDGELKPRQEVTLVIRRRDGTTQQAPLTLRIDTPIEAEYLRHGGILPYVLRGLLAA
ncbi:MAG: aconitate hydratase, partial [Stutzerimonas stutzeri]